MRPVRRLGLVFALSWGSACLPEAHELPRSVPLMRDAENESDGEKFAQADSVRSRPAHVPAAQRPGFGRGRHDEVDEHPHPHMPELPPEEPREPPEVPESLVHSCRSEHTQHGVTSVFCAEWEGPQASELVDLCRAPGTSYAPSACAREGAVGTCTYPEQEGLTIRYVHFESPEWAESSCRVDEGVWAAP